MTPSSAPDPAALAEDLNKILCVVTTAHRLVEDNRTVDLTALEGKMAAVCKAVTTLPRDQSRAFLPTLETLAAGLDDLEAALRGQFGALVADRAAGPRPWLAGDDGPPPARAARAYAARSRPAHRIHPEAPRPGEPGATNSGSGMGGAPGPETNDTAPPAPPGHPGEAGGAKG